MTAVGKPGDGTSSVPPLDSERDHSNVGGGTNPQPPLCPEGIPIPGIGAEARKAAREESVTAALEVRVNVDLAKRNAELETKFSLVCEALCVLSELRLEGFNLRDHAIAEHGEEDLDEWYDAEDEGAPFFTEAFLYNLLGKEDARTVLAAVREIQRALGLSERAFV